MKRGNNGIMFHKTRDNTILSFNKKIRSRREGKKDKTRKIITEWGWGRG